MARAVCTDRGCPYEGQKPPRDGCLCVRDATPLPGSYEAVSQGCLCPRTNDGNGVVWQDRRCFSVAVGCPLHWKGSADA